MFIVTEKAMRPTSPKRECFYCGASIGTSHLPACVLIHRTATIKFTVKFPVQVTAHWTTEDVDYHRNGSTWCSQNVLKELKTAGDEAGCLCDLDPEFECVQLHNDSQLTEEKLCDQPRIPT